MPNGFPSRPDPAAPSGRAPRLQRRRVVLGYLVLALAWIVAGDAAVAALATDARQAALLQAAKGIVFACASAWLLYRLLRPRGASEPGSDLAEVQRTRGELETSNRELHAMAGRLFSLQEDERRAISRDLHDDIGQSITAIKLSAWAALDEDDDTRRRDDLQQIVTLADTTVGRLRDLSTLLRPPQLDALGLEAALRWQAGVLFRSAPSELLASIDALPRRPDNDIEQACFRIAQESLTNALRHARASQVLLQLQDAGQGRLHLQVRDDGEGFDPGGPRGLGLIVMRERAQSVGGVLRIESAPGEGTLIDLHLPYQTGASCAATVDT